jgi:transcriptional regulator with XRE-family HTH domain
MIFRLAHYRRLKSMTQVQVAEAIGISQGLYNQLESGKRRMNETYLEALAELYSIAPALLIVITL